MEKVTFVQKVLITHKSKTDHFLILIRNINDKSRPGDFDLPGGSVKDGELHEVALVREVKEETGLEITDIKPVLINSSYDHKEQKYFIYVGYKAIAMSDNVVINPNEHSKFIWMTAKEFILKAPNHILVKHIKNAFK